MWAAVAAIAYAGVLLLLPRIWRMGKVSDRTAALMLLFNMPVLILAALALSGAPMWLFALAAILMLPWPLLYYRFTLTVMADARAAAPRDATWWQGFSPLARWVISAVAVTPSLILMVVVAWLLYTGRLQG
jgi:hypothetical protein